MVASLHVCHSLAVTAMESPGTACHRGKSKTWTQLFPACPRPPSSGWLPLRRFAVGRSCGHLPGAELSNTKPLFPVQMKASPNQTGSRNGFCAVTDSGNRTLQKWGDLIWGRVGTSTFRRPTGSKRPLSAHGGHPEGGIPHQPGVGMPGLPAVVIWSDPEGL